MREAALVDSGVKHVFVTRDPRDICISYFFYVIREKNHYMHKVFANLDIKQGLELLIRGDQERGLQSIGERIAASAGWLTGQTHALRFEDLVGAQGGGDKEIQKEAVRRLFEYLGILDDSEAVDKVACFLYSNRTRTFRKGSIGQWAMHFDDQLRELFKQSAGQQLIDYGYASNLDW